MSNTGSVNCDDQRGRHPDLCNRHQNCLPSVFNAVPPQHCSSLKSHPALNVAMGCLPGQRYGVDMAIMNATLHETLEVWRWNGLPTAAQAGTSQWWQCTSSAQLLPGLPLGV